MSRRNALRASFPRLLLDQNLPASPIKTPQGWLHRSPPGEEWPRWHISTLEARMDALPVPERRPHGIGGEGRQLDRLTFLVVFGPRMAFHSNKCVR